MSGRRKYFIEKSFQAKFILKFCAIVIVASIVIGVLLFFLSKDSTTVAIENTKVVVKNTSDFLFPLILTTLILVTIFSAISVTILCLFISHKISGPLYRLKREVGRIKEGDLNANFRIRAGDEFKELALSLEETFSFLREKIKNIKERFNSIHSQLKHPSINDEDVIKIKESLDYFKI